MVKQEEVADVTMTPVHEQQQQQQQQQPLRQQQQQPSYKSKAAREERKRVLKMSVRKLKEIDDPEVFLCR